MYQQDGGKALIEVLISDELAIPALTRTGSKARISLPPTISYDEIMEAIGSELTTIQAVELFDLWCNDAALRDYSKVPEGWLITLKELSSEVRLRKSSLAPSVERA
jgi:hypothetical protein